MIPVPPKDRLLSLLTAKAYKQGIFTLASGKQSDFYINCKNVALTALGHKLIGTVMFEHIQDHISPDIKVVAGVALGGCSLASAVSTVSIFYPGWCEEEEGTMDVLYVRKEAKDHGTKSLIEGVAGPGSRVVLLEDVATTGGSAIQAVKVLREAGYVVEHVLVLVDRMEGATENLAQHGLKLHSIFTRKDFINPNG